VQSLSIGQIPMQISMRNGIGVVTGMRTLAATRAGDLHERYVHSSKVLSKIIQ